MNIKWTFRTQAYRRNGFDIIRVAVLCDPDHDGFCYVAQINNLDSFFGCTPFLVNHDCLFETKEQAFNEAELFFAHASEYLAALRHGYRVMEDEREINYQDGDYIRNI